MEYDEARKLAISALAEAIKHHKNEQWLSIGDDIEAFEAFAPESDIEPNSLLSYTLEFWSSWSSCAEHTWDFEPNIQAQEWPELAIELIENLKSNSIVTNKKIIKNFTIN